MIAAFGSISPLGIAAVFDLLDADGFVRMWAARDEAVREGLAAHAPDLLDPLARFGPDLWAVVDALPSVGRVFFGAHLGMSRPTDPALSGWHAVNCLREWRGRHPLGARRRRRADARRGSRILHNAWLGYEGDWLALSRGTIPEALEDGWRTLETKDWRWAGRCRTGGSPSASRSRTTPTG